MSDRLEAIRSFREQVGGEVPIMGWVEGALAEAADLRGLAEIMLDLAMQPEWVEELLEICAEVAIAFARAQIEAGADIIGLGDAVGSLVSPPMYRRFALPYEQRIFAAVHEMGAVARLHICGNTNRIVADMVDSGADIIDLDWMVDMAAAAEQFGDRVSFCGNQDPVVVMLEGTPDDVYEAVAPLHGDRRPAQHQQRRLRNPAWHAAREPARAVAGPARPRERSIVQNDGQPLGALAIAHAASDHLSTYEKGHSPCTMTCVGP